MPRRSSFSHRLPARHVRRLGLAGLALLLAIPALQGFAQQAVPSADSEGALVPEVATLSDARGETTISVLELPSGPLLALAPIAARLGVAMTTGPLGERHHLTVRQQTVVVGPDAASMVIVAADGDEQIVSLASPPRRALEGLYVPLDFLEQALGDALGLSFRWQGEARRLDVTQRQERELRARLLQVRQGPVTTVEITFSQRPRYRVERHAGGLDIQLLGDRLSLGEPFESDANDPLVTGIEVEPSRLRISLADDAAAADPRLLGAPPRLVVEIFRRRASRQPATADGARAGTSSVRRGGLRTIVLDPGHGGSETGAISASGVVEKDLTLWFARALARRLERRLRVRVLLTRSQDQNLPLDSRTAFANQHKADLFVSLHLNSWFGRGAHGAETYFLSRSATDQRAADAAALENQDGADGDPDLGLELILWDLAQSYHLAESQRLANLVQEELNASLGLTDRGVKQAPFRVLLGASMPAVVVELGFLSNPDESSKLQDPAYRSELVEALVRAIGRFKMQLDAGARGAPDTRPDDALDDGPDDVSSHAPGGPHDGQNSDIPEAVSPEAVSPEAVSPEAVSPEAVSPEAVSPVSPQNVSGTWR